MVSEVRLPPSLLYPIEVVERLVKQGDSVKKHQPVLKFKYWNRVPDGVVPEDDGTEPPEMVTREFYATFESPFPGKVTEWLIAPGERINDHLTAVLRVQEPCDHSVQFGGLCAICGATLDNQDYMGYSDIDRAPIAMSHDTQGLTVSRPEAERIEHSATQQLLRDRKLILVVDLDQTVIHAAVDPEIGRWIADPSSPNHEAVKEVHSFALREPVMAKSPHQHQQQGLCWYYVKLRPGLAEFLQKMSLIYEMHIYTMATKSYAAEIAKIIDPKGEYFGDRILSRDDSGNLLQKDLNRLFPVTQSLVTIIDDRGDVWRWSPHLLRVAPYHFFSGTGDINSNFLPKRDGLVTPEGEENAPTESEGACDEHGDHELQNVGRALIRLHKEFYDRYVPMSEDDSQSGIGADASLSESKPGSRSGSKPRPQPRSGNIPDIGKLLPALKTPVFDGCIMLFSGIFPLGTNPDSADIVQWVRSFGAIVVADYLPAITHVIARNGGTTKARQAAGAGKEVITIDWIFACLEAWSRVATEPFRLSVPDPIAPPPSDVNQDQVEHGEQPQSEIAAGFVRSLSRGDVDWDEVNEELKEFMGSDDSDLDEEAVEDDNDEGEEATQDLPQLKRRRGDDHDDDSSTKRPKIYTNGNYHENTAEDPPQANNSAQESSAIPKAESPIEAASKQDAGDDDDDWITELEQSLS